jgi:hypothetical protein
MAGRSRKSKVHRVHPEIRQLYERMFREDRHTLDEIHAAGRELAAKLGVDQEAVPSRTGLHRYRAKFDEMSKRLREQRAMAELVVGELGDGIGEKSAALLSEAVNTLVTHVALEMQDDNEATVEDARKLARAAKDAVQVQRVSRQEREEIARAAVEKAMKAQRSKIEALGKSGALDADSVALVIRAAYDL